MIGVVSNDAGGAEVISSYIVQQGLHGSCLYSLSGPAIKIFKSKLDCGQNNEFQSVVDSCDWILCGTSWESDLEIKAIKYARYSKKKSVVFLEHWVNYKERFVFDNVEYLPDELWVGDKYAEDLANKYFPDILVKLIDNPYILDIRNKIKNLHPSNQRATEGVNILYVTEPIREHMLIKHSDECYLGYTEHDALLYCLENIDCLGNEIKEVVIRPHPSEINYLKKYDWALNAFSDIPVRFGQRLSLLEELIQSDVVIGCESMAMVVGLAANKRVVSCIPPQGPPSKLPHEEIEMMNDLISQSKMI